MALLRRLSEQGGWASLLALARPVVVGYLEISGRWTERIEACNLALAGLPAAPGTAGREANWLTILGLAFAGVGRVTEAIDHYDEALVIHRETGHQQGEGADLGNLGSAYYRLGQVEQAIDYYEQALAIQREIGDRQRRGGRPGQPGARLRRAWARSSRSSTTTSRPWPSPARSVTAAARATSWATWGSPTAELGQVEQAIEYYEQALAISARHRRPPRRGGKRPGQPGERLRSNWARSSRPSSTTSRPWPFSPRDRRPPRRGGPTWATWGTPTAAWASSRRPSTTTSVP